ncbi:MAG TPA: MATE family efflux transporter [Tissierellaceae bacterium]|nr:MATE family efflux transporter [Tissierellaceae bacterium]
MDRNIDLTKGNIFKTLVKLALPIMGTSFIHMAYNLTDIMWLGRLSTEAVAAAGTAGFFMWFGSGLILMSQIGVGVEVAQAYGRNDIDEARKYISNGIQLNIIMAMVYGIILIIFRHLIIGFFKLTDINVYNMSIEYLIIISIGMVFNFINPVLSTILNSSGDSMTPFKVNAVGLVFNMLLDPLFIFGLGPIKGMGIKGAAIATVLSQVVVTLIFLSIGKKNQTLYFQAKLFNKLEKAYILRIVKLGFPAFLQTSAHSSISMVLTRIIAKFGPVPIAVQSVGSKIESISWMTAEGFSAAISAFMGQNYGAKKYERIREGYKKGMQIVGSIGIFATLLLILAAEPLFAIFVPEDPMAIAEGARYLRILGYSQFFMSIEIGTAGAFNGLGRTLPPAIVGVSLNALRIPVAIYLSTYTALGLSGVWWSISSTSIVKGILLATLFITMLRRRFPIEENI